MFFTVTCYSWAWLLLPRAKGVAGRRRRRCVHLLRRWGCCVGCSMHCISQWREQRGEKNTCSQKFLFFFVFFCCCPLDKLVVLYFPSFFHEGTLSCAALLGASLTCVSAEVFLYNFFFSCTVCATCTKCGGCIWHLSRLTPMRLVFPPPKAKKDVGSHIGFVVGQAEFCCSLSFLSCALFFFLTASQPVCQSRPFSHLPVLICAYSSSFTLHS